MEIGAYSVYKRERGVCMMDAGKENFEEANAKEVAWELFKKSGNINYYRLYADLKNEEEQN